MKHEQFIDLVEANPVVAAVKDDAGLEKCLASDIGVVFVLYGDIVSIPGIVSRLNAAGKIVLVHMDLITGLAPKEVSVDFIHAKTSAAGIISTRSNLIEHAASLGMNTVLRYFMIDSIALRNVQRQSESRMQPDIVEILPAILLPEFISKIKAITRVPLMASGLVTTKKEVLNALNAGAVAVSTTDQRLWTA